MRPALPSVAPEAADIGSSRYRDASVYRYSVSADRSGYALIEAGAKASGISATAFVQRHFDTLVDGLRKARRDRRPVQMPEPAAQPARPRQFDRGEEKELARRLGIKHASLVLYRLMEASADDDGLLRLTHVQMSEAAGLAQSAMPALLKELQEARLIAFVDKPIRNKPIIWRVHPIEVAP